MGEVSELSAEALYRRCDPSQFDFQTTADLEDLTEIIGQPWAVAATRFGIDIEHEGYNIFALGSTGIGKHASWSRPFSSPLQGCLFAPISGDSRFRNCLRRGRKLSDPDSRRDQSRR